VFELGMMELFWLGWRRLRWSEQEMSTKFVGATEYFFVLV